MCEPKVKEKLIEIFVIQQDIIIQPAILIIILSFMLVSKSIWIMHLINKQHSLIELRKLMLASLNGFQLML